MNRIALLTIGVSIAIILSLNIFISEPTFNTIHEKLEFAVNSKQYKLAEELSFEILKSDSTNIDNSYSFLHHHFDKSKKGFKYEVPREDSTIRIYFEVKSNSQDTAMADIGNYGLGLYYSMQNDCDRAFKYFQKVKNRKLKYLNNSLGYVYKQRNRLDSAEFYIKKEIANEGNLKGAYSNLGDLLLRQNRFRELKLLIDDKESNKFIGQDAQREVNFYCLQFGKYFRSIVIEPIKNATNYLAFISALLILLAWLLYLRRIDVFEPEPWIDIAFVFIMGMMFSFLVYPFTDLINIYGHFRLNGSLFNDFIYCILSIGFIEESVKIFPLLILIRYSRIINEPLDFIIYASVTALGFAFIENIKYFDYFGLDIVHGRALISAVVHMFCTSLIAYGIVFNQYVKKKNVYFNFFLFLGLSAFVHGFFDFWLINDSAKNFAFISILMVFILISLFNSFINNTLNQSTFYNSDVSVNKNKMQTYLFVSLVSIFIFEYTALTIKFSPEVGNNGLIKSIYSGTYLVAFIISNLSKFKIVKGEWGKMHIWNVPNKKDYSIHIVNRDVYLLKFNSSPLTNQFLPNKGIVVSNHSFQNYPNWYKILLTKEIESALYSGRFVYVRLKTKSEVVQKGVKTLVGMYLIPKEVDINMEESDLKRLKFIGWAKFILE
jgi:protease PrsW